MKLVRKYTSIQYANHVRNKISDDKTLTTESYGAKYEMKEDHGTSHISVLARNGDAVSVTSTVNTL